MYGPRMQLLCDSKSSLRYARIEALDSQTFQVHDSRLQYVDTLLAFLSVTTIHSTNLGVGDGRLRYKAQGASNSSHADASCDRDAINCTLRRGDLFDGAAH